MVQGPREGVVVELTDEGPGHRRGSDVRLALGGRDGQGESEGRLHDQEDPGHHRHPRSRSQRLGWSWVYEGTLC